MNEECDIFDDEIQPLRGSKRRPSKNPLLEEQLMLEEEFYTIRKKEDEFEMYNVF